MYVSYDLNKEGAEEAAVRKLEDCIEDIRKWMAINKLKLNDDKSELIVFTPSRQTYKSNIQHIKMRDCIVCDPMFSDAQTDLSQSRLSMDRGVLANNLLPQPNSSYSHNP